MSNLAGSKFSAHKFQKWCQSMEIVVLQQQRQKLIRLLFSVKSLDFVKFKAKGHENLGSTLSYLCQTCFSQVQSASQINYMNNGSKWRQERENCLQLVNDTEKTFAKLLSSHEKLLCYFVAKPISAIWHECYIYRSKKVALAFLKKRQNSGRFSVIFSRFDNTFCLMLRQLRCALLIQTRVSQFHASAQ